MTEKIRTKNMNGPISCASAADRIITLLADLPGEAAIKARIEKEVAEQKRNTQARVSALVGRVAEGDRPKLGRLIVALLDGKDTCGIAIEAANDAEPEPVEVAAEPGTALAEAVADIPARLREPLSEERQRIGRGR